MAGKTAAAPPPADGVADELYALPLDEFTDVRNERAKQAREAGDRPTADAIRKLAKPNTVAWLANQLVRRHRDEIEPLLQLGAALREATAGLDAGQLRALSKQQHQVIYALVQQARRLAADVDQPVTDATARGLEDTLHAALADESAARALSSGRLTSGLSSSGFPGVDAAPPPRTPPGRRADRPRSTGRGSSAAPDPDELARRRLQRAEEDEGQARADAQLAGEEREAARQRLADAQATSVRAADEVERLQAELDKAAVARDEADRAERQARRDADRADQAANRAERRLADATARREQLES